jgi:diamine N-acetyltransferase
MKKIHIRRLESCDLSLRVEWFNTPSIYNQMVIDVPVSLSNTQQWFSKTLLNFHRLDVVFENEQKEIIAMGGLTDINNKHHHAELYIVVHPNLTGQGIGKEAIYWLCNWGFNTLQLNKIYLHTLSTNIKAFQLYERIGFQQEGVLRDHVFCNGKYINHNILSILKSEWENYSWRDTSIMLEKQI